MQCLGLNIKVTFPFKTPHLSIGWQYYSTFRKGSSYIHHIQWCLSIIHGFPYFLLFILEDSSTCFPLGCCTILCYSIISIIWYSTVCCQINCFRKIRSALPLLLKAESDQQHSNYKCTKRKRQLGFESNPIWTVLSLRALIIHCLCICAEHARSEFHIIKKALHWSHRSWQL